MLIVRSKLYYTASGVITPVGGRPVHRLIEDSLIQYCLGVLVLMYLFCITNLGVLLTVHLSVILVINQLNAQNLVL